MSSLWLPLVLIIQSNPINDLRANFTTSLYLIVAILCWGMACILVNDLSDRKEDYAAGKKRWICQLSNNSGVLIVIILVGIGFSSTIFANGSSGIIIVYAAAIAVGFLYSLRPVRFKERGLLGLLAYSLSATLGYVLVPWMGLDSNFILLTLLVFAVMLDKWVNLHFHQIVDYQADFNRGSRTYAVRVGLERTRWSLQPVSLLASISIIGVLAFIILSVRQEIIWCIIISVISILVVVATGAYTRILDKKSEKVLDLVSELPWIYLGLTYLLFRILPPIIFTHLALKEPMMWILVALSCVSLFGESLYSIRYQYE